METNSFISNFLTLVGTKDRWPELLNEIDMGNVIPVIGPDLLVEPHVTEDGRVENLHQQIISFLASQFNVKSRPRTFSQLVYDDNFRYNSASKGKETVIFPLIKMVLNGLDNFNIKHKPSQLLMDLLGTKRFPFVITTSFTPVVEQAMEKIWESSVKVLTFNNNPNPISERDKNEPVFDNDISSEEDLKRPTVFYMLGRYSKYPEFAVTDSDMMNYCASWIKGEGVPNVLINALNAWDNKNDKSKRYLLFLGNNYSDWLYRFVWFALRTKHEVMKSDVIVNKNAEDSLIQFLERLETFYQENPTEVIQRIKEEMDARQNNNSSSSPIKEYDVFISYSRRDIKIAKNLYNNLTDKGLQVWFDQKSIETESWKVAQNYGVKRCRLFIPILTKNVANEALDDHEYRSEWKIAHERSEKMGARPFIIPFAEQGFDFYNSLIKLPDSFKDQNGRFFSNDNDLEEITDVVIQALKKLEEMKNELLK